MRNMSFMLTTEQMYNETKSVTRRCGWWFLKPGDIVMACEKCQGLKKGEKIKRIYPIEIISTSSVHLYQITKAECVKEGFPRMTPDEFVLMFCKEMKVTPYKKVNRIKFKRIR
jgi:hypothetical protein